MSNDNVTQDAMVEEFWRNWIMEGPPATKRRQHRFYRLLPSDARCKFCYAPFEGTSGTLVKTIFQVTPSRFNPHYCNFCDDFASKHQGGAEVPITMLFADIRGSTALAERIGQREFGNLINRFYVESTTVLSYADAMIEKLAGDEVTAMFTRGIAGENYSLRAIEAAKELLRVTGHGDAEGPWIPVGIGIHTGEAFVGSVGQPNGIMEVAALGDVPNTASRLTSHAALGEILVSADAMGDAQLNTQDLEKRHLDLKGRSEGIDAYVLHL
ncbi:MAG: adenylate/guanylate cyclase domain-containing protein [Anaerolineales bacterium]|nr:adenylate/guanylate cyclase domain-containing protein [Anaerolineales bacterium]